MNETVTRRHALATIGGSIVALAAAAVLSPTAPAVRVLERHEPENVVTALLLHLPERSGDLALVWCNRARIDRATAERWAHGHLAAGERYADWLVGESAA